VKSTLSYILAFSALPLVCAACGAAAPSPELLTARDAYAKIGGINADQDNLEGTREAHRALEAAEEAHREDAGSERERSYAYVAARKSEMAKEQANEAIARKDREAAEQAYQAQLVRQLSAAQMLARTQQMDSEKTKKELVGWRKKGEDLVITLSGVLFDTGGHGLSPDAKKRLDVVVHAATQNPDRGLTIAGYTDAKGSDQTNRELSQKRADEVKAYLESKGVAGSRIASEGRGESNAIASNDTEAGRAENRRVEITLHRAGELPERQPVKGTDPEPAPKPKAK
jgi:outer membrane protein OmpA-like peptidoglycan-associated protein